MRRSAVNPWDWSLPLGYNQGDVLEGVSRQLICAGQTAVGGSGASRFEGDMRGDVGLALVNLEAVLAKAGMGPGQVMRLVAHATDVDVALRNLDLTGMRFFAASVAPPMTQLGITRLAVAGFMFEIDATAKATA